MAKKKKKAPTVRQSHPKRVARTKRMVEKEQNTGRRPTAKDVDGLYRR